MSEFVRAASVKDIAPGQRLYVEFDEETVIILNIGGKYYAIADVCSHDGGPLEDGPLHGYAIECPRHGAQFDVRNGKVVSLPATAPIPTYEVEIRDGDIFVEVPEDTW